MGNFEYKVLPAPKRAKRAKGVKGGPARFAHAITELMNAEAAEGWEYFKSETLPMEAKAGMFKGAVETFQTLLIFRRSLDDASEGEILSVTPQQTLKERQEPSLAKEPEVEGELTATKPAVPEKEIDDTLRADRSPVEFDENDIDPLKNLVDDHRSKS